jgi:hypothetical protein
MREGDMTAPARGLSPYGAGVIDGDDCRRQGGTVSLSRLVTINDDYSSGFRAGYFQRGLDTPRTVVLLRTKGIGMQWWGYSTEHGWVVLDRRIPCNAPGLRIDLLFLRCRDSTTFTVKRESWTTPAYRFAPNYIRELAPAEADAAVAELDALKERWPEFEREIERRRAETEEAERAVRLEAERSRKQAAAEKRKQAAPAKE